MTKSNVTGLALLEEAWNHHDLRARRDGAIPISARELKRACHPSYPPCLAARDLVWAEADKVFRESDRGCGGRGVLVQGSGD
jgi:hypothetical protein